MSDNAEEGIFRAQATAAKAEGTQGDALRKHHNRSIVYLDERVLTSIFGVGALGLIAVWATAKSALVIYGSFAGVILLTLVFGYTRMKRIERTKQDRAHEAESWKSDNTG